MATFQASRRSGAACGVLVTLLSRLGPLAVTYRTDPKRLTRADTSSYEQPVLALLEHGVFASRRDSPAQPELVRTPGYP